MKKKTTFRMYPAWAFEREVRDLDAQSEQGWQLVKGGLFRSTFAFDDGVRYRYALDFDQDIQNPMRYREMFTEQGWEFINSTSNGWHYFRKVYDPALPEQEYQIYTDASSRQEMLGRWKRLARILGLIELVLAAVELSMNLKYPAIHGFCLTLGCLLLGVLLLLAGRWMGREDRPKAPGWLLVPIFCFFLAGVVFSVPRFGFTTETEYAVPEDNIPWQMDFDVTLPDIYTLNVSVDSPEPVTFTLVKDAEERPVYRWEGMEYVDTIHFFFTPGRYSIYTSYLSGAEPGAVGTFQYELH